MKRSPTLEGFRLMFGRPSFGLAEIAWRWSFGCAAAVSLAFAFLEYLDTLTVTPTDLFLLKTRHPILVGQAMRHIFRGSGFRVVSAIVILAITLGIGWIVIGSLARAATLKALLSYFRQMFDSPKDGARWQMTSLFTLNFFRMMAALAASVGCFGAFLLAGAASRTDKAGPGSVFLIVLSALMLVWLAWSVLNWFFSLAAVFVVADGEPTFGALTAAVNLCRTRTGAVFSVGTWFGLAHITAFFVATSVVAVPLSLGAVLPAGFVLGGVLLVTLLYFAVADFLYVGRLAAYVAILELPEPIALPSAASAPMTPPTESRVDPSELILSDVPS